MAEELAQISIPNFPSGLKDKLEREAERQDRSLASLLRKVITEYADTINETIVRSNKRNKTDVEFLSAP